MQTRLEQIAVRFYAKALISCSFAVSYKAHHSSSGAGSSEASADPSPSTGSSPSSAGSSPSSAGSSPSSSFFPTFFLPFYGFLLCPGLPLPAFPPYRPPFPDAFAGAFGGPAFQGFGLP